MKEKEAKLEAEPIFAPPTEPHAPCSWNECLSGHRWPPSLIIAHCPGCGGPFVVIKQENCPFCNEPVREMSARADFIPVGIGGVAARCKGVSTPTESIDLTLTRHAWQEAETNHLSFEAKREHDESNRKSG